MAKIHAIYHLMMKVQYICPPVCGNEASFLQTLQVHLLPTNPRPPNFLLTGQLQKIRFKSKYGYFNLYLIVIVNKDSVAMELKHDGKLGKSHG